MIKSILLFFFIALFNSIHAEDGYQLWLRYKPITNQLLRNNYLKSISGIFFTEHSPTLDVAREEMVTGLSSMLGKKPVVQSIPASNCMLAGTGSSKFIL